MSSSKYGGVTEYESVFHREWWRISADESKTAFVVSVCPGKDVGLSLVLTRESAADWE